MENPRPLKSIMVKSKHKYISSTRYENKKLNDISGYLNKDGAKMK